jgi:hypothetical protein
MGHASVHGPGDQVERNKVVKVYHYGLASTHAPLAEILASCP